MSTEIPISQLRVPPETEWPDEVRTLVEGFADKLGFMPNIMRAFALMPGHLIGWWNYFDELMRGAADSSLSKAQREMIAVVVSTENNCHY